MEFQELIKTRRSVRNFKEEPVEHGDLEEIIREASLAPSWKNSQTGRYYVVESPEMIGQFREMLPSFNQKSSANAAYIVSTYVKGISGFTQGAADNELGNVWGAYDLGLHDAYLVLAAANAGYDTLIMGLRDQEGIRRLLEIPEEECIVSVIAIGKRASEPVLGKRKDLAEVAKFF